MTRSTLNQSMSQIKEIIRGGLGKKQTPSFLLPHLCNMNGLLIVITSLSSLEPHNVASREPDLLPTWGKAHFFRTWLRFDIHLTESRVSTWFAVNRGKNLNHTWRISVWNLQTEDKAVWVRLAGHHFWVSPLICGERGASGDGQRCAKWNLDSTSKVWWGLPPPLVFAVSPRLSESSSALMGANVSEQLWNFRRQGVWELRYRLCSSRPAHLQMCKWFQKRWEKLHNKHMLDCHKATVSCSAILFFALPVFYMWTAVRTQGVKWRCLHSREQK